MNRIRTTALVTALAASALLAAGCEQRGQDTASRQGDAANSKLMGKADQPGLMGKSDQSAQSGQANQQAQSAPSQSLAQAGDKLVAAADDTAITAKVKASILAEPGLKSTQINVETRNATVTLSGTVDSGYAARPSRTDRDVDRRGEERRRQHEPQDLVLRARREARRAARR